MMSMTHTIMATAALARCDTPRRNWAVFIGSVLPDAFIYVFWAWFTFAEGETQRRIWDGLYFQAETQLIASIFNSIPIYVGIGVLGYLNRATLFGRIALFVSAAALIHIAFDLPFHNHDAYAHFWPLSDWRFISPLSYWEADFHARYVTMLECVLALTCLVAIWKRFTVRWVRILTIVFVIFYAALFVYRLAQ